ncbi:MAG: hypothetical protein KDD04_02130 [Sinomicrobium sp.]|nr:hypothetical protein [Sinomicrobium sp.]
MNKTFRERQLSFLLKLTVFALALLALHSIVIPYFLNGKALFYPLWQIYAFHFVTVFLVYAAINATYSRGKKKLFYTFIALTFLKMALAVAFLLPLLFSGAGNMQADVFSFFIPYFLFLGMEVYAISGFLSQA